MRDRHLEKMEEHVKSYHGRAYDSNSKGGEGQVENWISSTSP